MQWWFPASTCHWYPGRLPAFMPCAYRDTSPTAQQEYFGAVHLDRASFPFPRSTGDPGNSFIKSTMPLAGQNAPESWHYKYHVLFLPLPWATEIAATACIHAWQDWANDAAALRLGISFLFAGDCVEKAGGKRQKMGSTDQQNSCSTHRYVLQELLQGKEGKC